MRVEEGEKKESGIEKLIELLNEYEKEKMGEIGMRWTYYDRGFHRGEEGYYYSELQLISKSFGFIKWLVENGNINFDKLEDNPDWFYIDLSDNYLEILALLSIQDEPISFLISILN